MIKTAPYIVGDHRTIGMSYSWNPQDGIWQYKDGPLPGMVILAKGNVHETFYVDSRGVWRAEDTSYNDTEFYWLRDPGQPASLWIPAEIEEGAFFLRNPMVTVYRKSDGVEVSARPHRTWIRATKRSWTSARGVTFNDVLWVEVFDGDAAKAANQPWEIYVFAKGIGMVGWMELEGGQIKRHSDANHVWPKGDPTTPVLSVSPLPGNLRYTPLVAAAPPAPPVITDKGTGVAGVLFAGTYVNLRPAPVDGAEPAVQINNGTALVWYPQTETKELVDGYKWVYVEVGPRSGWMARVHPSWATQFAPLTENVPLKPSVSLDIPWVSQIGADAPDANDCGQTAAVSALRAVGKLENKPQLLRVTPDQFNDHLANKQTGANVSDMIMGLARYGVTARAFRATTANIKRELSAGNYPIVVLQRGKVPLLIRYNEFAEAHWLGVRGYDANGFTLVDALVTNGRDLKVDDATLAAALSGSSWNGTVQSGWIGIVVEIPQMAVPPVVIPPITPPVVVPAPPGFEIEFSTMDEKSVLGKGLKELGERIIAAPGRFVVINVSVKE